MATLARLAAALLGLLPRRLRMRFGRALGALAHGLGLRRRVARENLAIAFPERPPADRRRIARAAYRNLGASLVDFATSRALTDEELDSILLLDRFEIFERLFAERRGVVVASAHLGAWELMAAACARRGIPLNLVTRSLRGGVNRELVAARARSGLTEIPPRGALRLGSAALRRGEVVVNLIDQNMLPKRGVFVDYFGRPACTTPAVSLLALRTGAPAIVALAVNQPDGKVKLSVEGPFPVERTGSIQADVRAHTQRLSGVIERYVRQNPEQWLWLHRRWKTRPKGEVTPTT
ncbi:MAG: lysophospholipid acyltransferase family protein [Deltaproteobacteria bacterium]